MLTFILIRRGWRTNLQGRQRQQGQQDPSFLSSLLSLTSLQYSEASFEHIKHHTSPKRRAMFDDSTPVGSRRFLIALNSSSRGYIAAMVSGPATASFAR